MEEFFELLSALLQSDFGREYSWVMIVYSVLLILIIGVVLSFVYEKVIIPSRLIKVNNELRDSRDKLENLQSDNDRLKEDNRNLKKDLKHFEFQKALENTESEYVDKALERFAK